MTFHKVLTFVALLNSETKWPVMCLRLVMMSAFRQCCSTERKITNCQQNTGNKVLSILEENREFLPFPVFSRSRKCSGSRFWAGKCWNCSIFSFSLLSSEIDDFWDIFQLEEQKFFAGAKFVLTMRRPCFCSSVLLTWHKNIALAGFIFCYQLKSRATNINVFICLLKHHGWLTKDIYGSRPTIFQ